ncbi:exodeoxyribonuclease VII large subunit [candidate division KSB1 bacterium]|nr:exodeoxyribonuclease VII large subunit [candidate division KSB1 bacterium]
MDLTEWNKPSARRVYSVSEITRDIRLTLEDKFPSVWIEGEVSNFLRHRSGHLYFSLKDADAQIACVMWRSKNQSLLFEPQDGMKVQIFGSLTLYERQGRYQIDVHRIQPAGVGELQMAFEMLKQQLAEEGLFDPEHKQEIPEFPTCIGIVTSPTGAAIRDILSVLQRRFGALRVLLSPVHVQGVTAADEIARAIQDLNVHGEADVLIIGRGGGSIEDLWAFNEEAVARAIFESKIPIISAVGHEIDFSISDFVADVRAPTPSAAAELAVRNKDELLDILSAYRERFQQMVVQMISGYQNRIESMKSRWAFRRAEDLIREYRLRLDDMTRSHQSNIFQIMQDKQSQTAIQHEKMNALNPKAILNRGYSVVTRADESLSIKDASVLEAMDRVKMQFARGSAVSVVESIQVKKVERT